jgi:hypothetical protein
MDSDKPSFRVPKDTSAAKQATKDKLKDGLDSLKKHSEAKNANTVQR